MFPYLEWSALLGCHCAFSSDVFLDVMNNLIKNPNITSSHVFRADILYDSSVNDISLQDEEHNKFARATDYLSKFAKCMKTEYQPRRVKNLPAAFRWQRTIVRQIMPRNPQLDRPLVQTCHFLIADRSEAGDTANEERKRADETLIVFVPHVDSAGDVPWYHPKVEALAFLHSMVPEPPPAKPSSSLVSPSPIPSEQPQKAEAGLAFSPLPSSAFSNSQLTPPELPDGCATGSLSLYVRPFTHILVNERVRRTALKLLRTVHKHGQGLKAGYVKRGQHDRTIPQRRFQDTYVRLKSRYSRDLLAKWVEQTDPTKHVFEDLGIAAFLIELWRDMYGVVPDCENDEDKSQLGDAKTGKFFHNFPGFVDIGCGNGVLVYVLLQEGYHGWGFDARKRKTWTTFPGPVQEKVREMALIPWIFQEATRDGSLGPLASIKKESILPLREHRESANLGGTDELREGDNEHTTVHDGTFEQGTFIISNHADELTAWTPIIAQLCSSPFIVIPCCSHNLAGIRFRAPIKPTNKMYIPSCGNCADDVTSVSSISQEADRFSSEEQSEESEQQERAWQELRRKESNVEATSKRKENLKPEKPPSAYASLCNYITNLAIDLGFVPEREMLRIPSTRNVAIIGRHCATSIQLPDDSLSDDDFSVMPLQISGDASEHEVNTKAHGSPRDLAARVSMVRAVLKKELGDDMALRKAGLIWIEKTQALGTTSVQKTH